MESLQQLLEVSEKTLASYRASADAGTDSDGGAVTVGAPAGLTNGRMIGSEEQLKQLESQLEEKKTDVQRVRIARLSGHDKRDGDVIHYFVESPAGKEK